MCFLPRPLLRSASIPHARVPFCTFPPSGTARSARSARSAPSLGAAREEQQRYPPDVVQVIRGGVALILWSEALSSPRDTDDRRTGTPHRVSATISIAPQPRSIKQTRPQRGFEHRRICEKAQLHADLVRQQERHSMMCGASRLRSRT